jgi:hypothetical protein
MLTKLQSKNIKLFNRCTTENKIKYLRANRSPPFFRAVREIIKHVMRESIPISKRLRQKLQQKEKLIKNIVDVTQLRYLRRHILRLGTDTLTMIISASSKLRAIKHTNALDMAFASRFFQDSNGTDSEALDTSTSDRTDLDLKKQQESKLEQAHSMSELNLKFRRLACKLLEKHLMKNQEGSAEEKNTLKKHIQQVLMPCFMEEKFRNII